MKETHPEVLHALAIAFGALAVVGPALMVAGFAITGIGTALSALGAALAFVSAPVLLAIAAAAGAFYIGFKNWDTIAPHWERLTAAAQPLVDALKSLAEAMTGTDFGDGNIFPDWASEEAVVKTFTQVLDGLANTLERLARVYNAFKTGGVIAGAKSFVSEGAGWWGDAAKAVGGEFAITPGSPADKLFGGPGANAYTGQALSMDNLVMPELPKPTTTAPEDYSLYSGAQNSPLMKDGPLDVRGRVSLDNPQDLKAKIEGKAWVNVNIKAEDGAQVTGVQSFDNGGNIGANASTGTSMQETGQN